MMWFIAVLVTATIPGKENKLKKKTGQIHETAWNLPACSSVHSNREGGDETQKQMKAWGPEEMHVESVKREEGNT